MARRSSARLRNRQSSTPKRVSLSHDAPTRTPRTAPVKLQSVREYDEMPGAFPGSVSPPSFAVTNKQQTQVPLNFNDSTPKQTTPIQPTAEEMSPKHHQQSTAKLMEEARWLGFSNMAPHTEPPQRTSATSRIAVLQATPTKAPQAANGPISPNFHFTFGREQSLELSPEAKKLMSEKRDEALKIREQMVANGEGPRDYADLQSRRFAVPKGKKNRFSEVHLEQFKKMDSIAGHASAFRINPNQPNNVGAATPKAEPASQNPPKSLKRSPSKAELDGPEGRTMFGFKGSNVPQPTITKPPQTKLSRLPSSQDSSDSPAAKRVKRTDRSDTSSERSSVISHTTGLQTPQQMKKEIGTFCISTIASPTQASLARSASGKSLKISRIPGPANATSTPTPKSSYKQPAVQATKPSTPLLARSPSKAPLFPKQTVEKSSSMLSPLLMRTPSKHSPLKKAATSEDQAGTKPESAPLLSQSPLKMARDHLAESKTENSPSQLRTPLLARTPVKVSISEESAAKTSDKKPGSALGGMLMGRFSMLRSSPVKSILRSPQRLYSNDPAKVAAGTHLASPADVHRKAGEPVMASPSIIEKHVDFTSSTKARYERALSEIESTPSKGSTPEAVPSPGAPFADYPTLPTDSAGAHSTPQKRRQTTAPGDFTFTSHGNGIVFGQSPNAPASEATMNTPPTIRHVSAEPQIRAPQFSAIGGKKRKFDSDSDHAAALKDTSDKENIGEADTEIQRPAKRLKAFAPAPAATKVPSRPPTIGVKSKKGTRGGNEKKPSVISRARLNALAQPKRRE